ncbi:tRNA-splicing endonuclease subunit Sen34 [Patagioenas fasciata]|uniref:tRNA-splicing endonuclease subunit Sen34 n=1 Tax=Patagioenas fasciata TaxID=372321 RepID=UPI003A98D4A2
MAPERPERPGRPGPRSPGSGPRSPGSGPLGGPGPGLVFAAPAARALRERLRVWGRLVGPARRGGRRGAARGPRLPLQLRPEELGLLLRLGTEELGPLLRVGTEELGPLLRVGPRGLRERADGAGAVGLNWDPLPPNGSSTASDPAHPRDPAHPSDPDSAPQRRCRVFRALWGRGLHVTGGGKFGGDFLVYPGPPDRFHAVGVACVSAPWAELPALGLAAAARLGCNVRKTALLCAGGGACTSLQWRGDL